MKLKVMSFRTDPDQIDVLHAITHCTVNSASQIIRIAIDRELEVMQMDAELGNTTMPKEKKEVLDQYLNTLDHKDQI